MLPSRIFDLYYGPSGCGKSQAARDIILALYKLNGKKARVYIGDGSLQTYEPLIDAGIVEAMEFSHRNWPLLVGQRITEGWFPANHTDPTSPLIPPDKNGIENVGVHVFEGAATLASYLMSTIKGGLAQLAAEGHKLGQDTPFQIPQGDKDGKTGDQFQNFGGNPIAHYGIAQRHVVDFVQRSRSLSPYVIWTTHEYVNDPEKDTLNKEQIVGPEVAGKRLVASFQKMFGNTLHFQTIAKRGSDTDSFTGRKVNDLELDYRIWTRDHFSPDGNTMIRYRALTRNGSKMNDYYPSILAFYDDLGEKSKIDLDTLLAKA